MPGFCGTICIFVFYFNDMITFFKTILIILLVYYGLKIILKLAAPYIMKYFSKKLAARFGANFGNMTPPNASPEKEGEITIDKAPHVKKATKTVGEYIDYEEL
ncbi:MAG: hypothetical protein ACI9O8_001618 [Patiriisocius sp.]